MYQRIYADKRAGGSLWKQLCCQKRRRKRYGKHDRRGSIPNPLSIEQRPEIVEQRSRIGDWEADTVIGKSHKQAIVSLVERKSGFTLIHKVERKTPEAVSRAMNMLLKPFKHRVYTNTSDNGKEFAWHEEVAKALWADFYFPPPYASWERGTNENTNDLIRQEIEYVIKRLNNQPRKLVEYQTPAQVFFNSGVALQT